jgi:hypothetical protein
MRRIYTRRAEGGPVKYLLTLLAALLAAPLFGSDAPPGYDGTMEVDPIKGAWRCVGMEVGG